MNIIISNSSNEPIYEQIKEQIKNKIVSNELKTGDLLPSIRNLAKDLRISVIPAKGTYVANKNIEIIKEEQKKKVENLIETAISIAKISKISKKEINDILDILYEEES